MGIVRWHTTMSVDGFIAGPDHAMDWVFELASEPIPEAEAVMRSTGSIIAGRNTYDVGGRDDTPDQGKEAFGGGWSGPQFVVTHRPPPFEADPSITFVSGDVRSIVATAKEAADGRDVLVLGANVAMQIADAGLMDELLVHVVPILLGDGIRLVGPAHAAIELGSPQVTTKGGIATLRYRLS